MTQDTGGPRRDGEVRGVGCGLRRRSEVPKEKERVVKLVYTSRPDFWEEDTFKVSSAHPDPTQNTGPPTVGGGHHSHFRVRTWTCDPAEGPGL